MNNDRKIIFFDVDGTILSHRTSRISESTRSAIKAVQKNGHLACLNTGRTLAEMEQEITGIGFDGYVCGCGTYISLGSSVLLHHTLQPELIIRLLEDFRRYRLDAVLEGTKAVYYDALLQNPFFIKVRDDQIRVHGFSVRTFDDRDIEGDKFCILPQKGGDLKSFFKKYKNVFEFIDRGHDFFEIVPAGFSKATGIRFLEEHLGIPHENTYALGDSSNDLPMLNYVRHSIAMGNSSEEVRKEASFVTEDVDRDGVAHALRHYHII